MIFLSCLFFIIGILSGIYSPFIAFFSLIPLSIMIFYKRYQRKYYLSLIFLLIGFLISFFYPKGSNTSDEILGIVIRSKENYILLYTFKGKFYIPIKDNSLTLFSIVKVRGYSKELSFSHYESGFYFKEYLNQQGVFHQFIQSDIDVLLKSPIDFTALKLYIFQYADEQNKIISSSLLFSDSIYQLSDSNSLKDLNVINLLSLSGFHISFLLALITFILGKKGKKIDDIISLILSTIFLFLSSFSYSTTRIFTLAVLKVINSRTKIKLNYLSRLSITCIFLLFINPYSISSPSFYYPFPLLFFIAITLNSEKKKKWLFLLQLQLFYLPYTLFYNYSISIFGLLLYILLMPISQLMFIISCLSLLIPQIMYLSNLISTALLSVSNFFYSIDLRLISGKIPIFIIAIYYILFFLISIFKTYNYKREARVTALFMIASISIRFIPDIKDHYEISFIDVDQGDSTLIRYKKSNILIDTGGKQNVDMAKECLIPFLSKNKIQKLDAVILTHDDFDHSGALNSLKTNFKTDNIYKGEDFLNFEDDTIEINSLKIRNYNHYYSYLDEENTRSAVYGFSIKDTEILIMGDAPKEIEKKIIKDNPNLHADILHIGHHGSSTSSSIDFLKKIDPKICIISVGENNRYKHPSNETLVNLKMLNLDYRRTDKEGTITYRF